MILWVFVCVLAVVQAQVGYVSVVDYGAVADGTTDNANAFTNAINYAKANNISKVYVPAAQNAYVHSNIITLDQVTLYGDGYASWLYASNNLSSPVKLIGSNSGVRSLRLTSIAQPRSTVPWATTVWCYLATNITVDSVWVEPLPGEGSVNGTLVFGVGGIFIYGCQNGIVSNNNVNYSYADGIHTTNGCSNITVQNNVVENTGDDGVACVSYFGQNALNKDITFRNNTVRFNRWGRGISVIGGQNVIVEDNTVINPLGGGLWLSSESSYNTSSDVNVIVRRNKIFNAGKLSNGNCSGNSLPAMGLHNGNPNMPFNNVFKNIQFVDNYVDTGCRDLFRIDGSKIDDVTVAGNYFTNTPSFGVYVPGSNTSVYFIGNTVKNTSLNAIVTLNTQTQLAISGNQFIDPLSTYSGRTQALYLGNVEYLQFTDNTLSNTTRSYASIFLYVTGVNNIFVEGNVATPKNSIPAGATNFTLPIAADVAIQAQEQYVIIPASSLVSGSSATFLVAFGAQGGKVDTSFARDSVTFTFNGTATNGSFQFAVNGTVGVAVAKCTVSFSPGTTSPTSPTSSASSSSTASPSSPTSSTTAQSDVTTTSTAAASFPSFLFICVAIIYYLL